MLDDRTGATVVLSEMPTIARTSIDMYKQAVSKIVRHFRRRPKILAGINSRKQTFIFGGNIQAGCMAVAYRTGLAHLQTGWQTLGRANKHTDRMANNWTGW